MRRGATTTASSPARYAPHLAPRRRRGQPRLARRHTARIEAAALERRPRDEAAARLRGQWWQNSHGTSRGAGCIFS